MGFATPGLVPGVLGMEEEAAPGGARRGVEFTISLERHDRRCSCLIGRLRGGGGAEHSRLSPNSTQSPLPVQAAMSWRSRRSQVVQTRPEISDTTRPKDNGYMPLHYPDHC